MNRIRERIKATLPVLLADRLRDFRDKIQASRNHYSFQRLLGDRPVWRDVASALRVLIQPDERILFFPERPIPPFLAYALCTLLGYTITKDPKRRFDVVFKYKNRTVFDPAILDQVSVDRARIINAGSVDISKRTVGRVFAEIFGYPLDVDPLRYDGEIVEKSDANAAHDGRVVQGPLAPEDIRPGRVYQKVINSLSDRPGFFVDYRVPIIGGQIPFVYLKFRHFDDRFSNYVDPEMKEPDEIFSSEEVENILRLTRRMGFDFGEIDVLRDADGRIYVVDVNNTPGGALERLPKGARRAGLNRMVKLFDRMLQTRKMQKERRSTGV